ncbi:hypothetical protein A3D80_00595 [Candidatus Roizmanbacteria bacterium RIFCSPHIGHO2_02_FULL_40_13b]|uniref:DNA-binding response regulator n=1 Tax=Candidatus Roizmanbacteria bacterium RIFCSPHIGHO2_01_FULL_39_24 TaxID=1802032 RepID=A0A1F7GL31_9BACT|nr:MAG: hypothetical protein A2799_02560 [Candidatus Roizmanbacteria bacterium RIFCSPHIGHO2_01_FULL_39_24]OGK27445.1 MAG: hypothetical protein A3D80_00595 [Candidatus Roizmanbacteria bacterium RIFCSPHIGHO2_02_FULL_40_13b]OGK50002.1 MAG: hypothetical protein A3A56_00895 [Candidatus Roizmanbacteria bacterium RIFCSPLOWO2_01_FULL_40_32]OGK56512.1 MAG: hypothetical protein A3H83_01505 [Candidatus Roizmanbacteria bacterium RIFCSPLOWO2_02_FULL_39_8]
MNILLIEDDKQESCIIHEALNEAHSITVLFPKNIRTNLGFINTYDLIIIDFEICNRKKNTLCYAIRLENSTIPLLVLARRAHTTDKIHALTVGADDFLVKPIDKGELLARVHSLIRRTSKHKKLLILSVGNLQFDIENARVRRGNKLLHLRRKEMAILQYLMTNVGRVVTRAMILDHVWESDYEAFQNIVDAHVKNLRIKVDRGFRRKLIKTVYGFGYKIED